MRCFEVLRQILNTIYPTIPGPDKDAIILQRARDLKKYYNGLAAAAPPVTIDYRDPATRFAYLYAYTTHHANLVAHIVSGCPELKALLKRPHVKIASLGGGPGTDLLGIAKALLAATPPRASVKLYLYDKENAWGEAWSDVDDALDGVLALNAYFNSMDVTDPTSWEIHRNFRKADLVSMVYFLSELYRVRAQSAAFFEALFNDMRPGSLVLIADNAPTTRTDFTGWAEQIAAAHSFRVVATRDRSRVVLPDDEQRQVLAEYRRKLHDLHDPKAQAWVTWRVFQKDIA